MCVWLLRNLITSPSNMIRRANGNVTINHVTAQQHFNYAWKCVCVCVCLCGWCYQTNTYLNIFHLNACLCVNTWPRLWDIRQCDFQLLTCCLPDAQISYCTFNMWLKNGDMVRIVVNVHVKIPTASIKYLLIREFNYLNGRPSVIEAYVAIICIFCHAIQSCAGMCNL